MEILVKRKIFTLTTTIGEMFINGSSTLYGHTLEDVVRDLKGDCSKKVKNQTAIDYGRYQVILDFSEHFGKIMPHILNVPCFEGIRIHGGNTSVDTEGCILLGSQTDNKTKVWNCHPLVENFIDLLKGVKTGEKIYITITK